MKLQTIAFEASKATLKLQKQLLKLQKDLLKLQKDKGQHFETSKGQSSHC